jgi:hypothetical protein
MIQTIIKTYIIDFSISHFFDGICGAFSTFKNIELTKHKKYKSIELVGFETYDGIITLLDVYIDTKSTEYQFTLNMMEIFGEVNEIELAQTSKNMYVYQIDYSELQYEEEGHGDIFSGTAFVYGDQIYNVKEYN